MSLTASLDKNPTNVHVSCVAYISTALQGATIEVFFSSRSVLQEGGGGSILNSCF